MSDSSSRWNEDSTFKQMLDAMYGESPTERQVAGEETTITYDPAELQVRFVDTIIVMPSSFLEAVIHIYVGKKILSSVIFVYVSGVVQVF